MWTLMVSFRGISLCCSVVEVEVAAQDRLEDSQALYESGSLWLCRHDADW